MPCKHRVIYQPRGRAREFAPLALNIYNGCSHGCIYCYVPRITRKPVPCFRQAKPRPEGFFKKLELDAAELAAAGCEDIILLSFSSDPYQLIDSQLHHSRKALEILKEHGLRVCILSKGGYRALHDLDLLEPHKDEFILGKHHERGDQFATTLTSLVEKLDPHVCFDPNVSPWPCQYLEPFAAPPEERIYALKSAYHCGLWTWISLEPLIFPDQALKIIDLTHEFVYEYKIGPLNYHSRKGFPLFSYHQLHELLLEKEEQLGVAIHFKKDFLAEIEKESREKN